MQSHKRKNGLLIMVETCAGFFETDLAGVALLTVFSEFTLVDIFVTVIARELPGSVEAARVALFALILFFQL